MPSVASSKPWSPKLSMVSFLLKPEVIKMFLSPFAMWNEDTVKLGIIGHHLGHISGDEFLPLSVEWRDKWF